MNITFLENLKAFGLTGQETIIYEELLKSGAMSGYEVAKNTGISRSNVYSSLAGLVEKGACYVCDGETPKYTPVDVKTFTENYLRELSGKAEELALLAPQKKKESAGYITISGTRHIKDKIHKMLNDTKKRLYIMAESDLLSEYDDEIKDLIKKDLKVVILTDRYKTEGAVIYETVPETGQIRFITDSNFVLTGTLNGSEEDTCLYSDEPNLVAVMKEALKNKMSLIKLEEDE